MIGLILTKDEALILKAALSFAKSAYEDDYAAKLKALDNGQTSLSVVSFQNASNRLAAFCEVERKIDLMLR